MIGDNIQRLRKNRGITLSNLAERALIAKSYLSNIERNINKNPSIKVLDRITGVLEVDVQKIIHPEEEPKEAVQLMDAEWVDIIQDLQESGITKDNIRDYKILIEFINKTPLFNSMISNRNTMIRLTI